MGTLGVWEAHTPSLAPQHSRPRVDLPAPVASAQTQHSLSTALPRPPPPATEFTWVEQKFMNQRCHQPVLSKGVGKIPGIERLESYKLIGALPLLSE